MPLVVTVARIGNVVDDPEGGFTGLDEAEWDVPYAEREKVELEVHEDEPLGSVLARAAAKFGIPPPAWGGGIDTNFGFVAFHRPEHEQRFNGPLSTSVTLVDEEGRALWNRRFKDVPYAELLRAAEAGALVGDPLRPYLVVQPEIGNGMLPDWATVANLLDLAWYAMERFAVAYTTYKAASPLLERIAERLKRGGATIESHSSGWSARWGDPATVARFLAEVPRSLSEIARLLDCHEDEAEALLWAFGFAYDEATDLWAPAADPEADLLRGNFQLILGGFTEIRLEAHFRERMEIFLETGKAPPVRWGYEEEEDA